MFTKLLIALDGSEMSRKALNVAIELAKLTGASLYLVSVEENLPHYPADIGEVKEEKQLKNGYFKTIQREAREMAKVHGIDLDQANILIGNEAKTIVSHAKAIKCDLIVMGHSGQSGVWANFLGSTAEKISHHAHCTVMIVR